MHFWKTYVTCTNLLLSGYENVSNSMFSWVCFGSQMRVVPKNTDLLSKWTLPVRECRFLVSKCLDWRNCAILVIYRGLDGISDMPCENTRRTQEYSPCLCFYQALDAVFVIPADGNRQKLEVHRHRKGFVGNQSPQCLSLQALASGNLHWYTVARVLDGGRLQLRRYCMHLVGFN